MWFLYAVHIDILRTDTSFIQGKNPALFEDFGKEQFRKMSVYTTRAYIVKHCLEIFAALRVEIPIQVTYSEGVRWKSLK